MRPKILFMGTPEIAIPSLEILIHNNYNVVGVVTQPDRPKGRGRKVISSPVKICAEKFNIPVYQPGRVRDEGFLSVFRGIAPDIVVLVAFGQILPREIIDFPRLGCINVHPSLLPKYRGAAPIHWAIINGEKKTGVTIMYMSEEVDAGDILLQEETDIVTEEVCDELCDRLSMMGAELLLKAVNGIIGDTVERIPQDSSCATFAPRLTKEVGHIDWNNSVYDILNLIRGLSSSPAAYTFLNGKKVKILSAAGAEMPVTDNPGKLGDLKTDGLQVAAKDGYVYLKEIQLEGKKRMLVIDFLRGYRLAPDEILR